MSFNYVKLDKVPFSSIEEILSTKKFRTQLIEPQKLSDDPWTIRSESFSLLDKLNSSLTIKLIKIAKPVYGILTGLDKVMVIDKSSKPILEKDITKSIVWSSHIDKWFLQPKFPTQKSKPAA